MSTFTESQWQAHKRALAARHHETFGVQPGQFATAPQQTDEEIRARNHQWSHQFCSCWRPSHIGQEL